MPEELTLPDLAAELDALLAQIPPGRVTTYGELARALGDVRLAAWIGERLGQHPHSEDCRCHRVVRATGELGRYVTGDPAEKAGRLAAEGISIADGRVDLAAVLLQGDAFRSDAPLARLQRQQSDWAARVLETPLPAPPRMLCGLDVAYPAAGLAQGAAVLCDAQSLERVWQHTLCMPAPFPYVPGYLAFRELPVLLALWREAAAQADSATVCLVDGNGRLHPRRAGVAACFGVLANVPTIGLAKSLLCGRVDPDEPRIAGEVGVYQQGEALGAMLPGRRGGRPVYISVGHRLTLPEAVQIARAARTRHRLPEPLDEADRLSKLRSPGSGTADP